MKKFGFIGSVEVLLILFLTVNEVSAQYFGRNKPRYESFDFKVLQTPHLELYHYLDDSSARRIAQMGERWYNIHQQTFADTILYRNPVIFYANHADFQQTGAVNSLIGIGTGGVTEAFKNRVVMPVMESHRQTDHVLGHELVHAFQYNLLKASDSLSLKDIQNLPLWMVEGLAEYLSIGRVDAHTAMWMRDAMMNDDIPSIKDLNKNPKYFPYRYGQAFWAFVGGAWGDSTAIQLYKNTARYGLEFAIDTTLNLNSETLSNMWKASLQTHYGSLMKDSVDHPVGQRLVDKASGGNMNISPALSPNGDYFIFLSERDLFTIDLYLADTRTGEVIRKLSSATRNDHMDAISYIESAGTWSPDGSRFAYVTYSKGKNKLVVLDVRANRVIDEINIPGFPAFSNPSWSPQGNQLVVSGLLNGQSDLFIYDFENNQTAQLTNDYYADIQPSWSPDGKWIVFATDRLGLTKGTSDFNLALLDLSNGFIHNIHIFPGADNLNPVFAGSENVLFLSNRDGFRNLYRYDIGADSVYQLTELFTGISGITMYSPAISYSHGTNEIVYSYYSKNGYTIYKASLDALIEQPIDKNDVDFTAAILPPAVNQTLPFQHMKLTETSLDSLHQVPYQPKFKLDYIGNTNIGVSVSTLGTGLVGGVNTLFSDILGYNQLFAGIALNGEIYDFGGQAAFFNQKHRLGWGIAASHIPYRSGGIHYGLDSLQISDTTVLVENYALDLLRTFEDRINPFAYYPISQTRRIELGGSVARYGFRIDRFNNYYYQGIKVAQSKEKLPKPSGYNLWSINTAYVGDNSHFGVAAPLKGHRYRYEITKIGGEFDFYTVLADYRKYLYLKPISLAGRVYHFSRHGTDTNEGRISPMFLGFPTLIRGYDDILFRNGGTNGSNQLSVNDLFGNKMVVANFELRIPFTGPERLALIKSRYFFTDLNLFMDIGSAWDAPVFESREGANFVTRKGGKLISSTGISLRLNLFGQMIIEPYFAIPWQRDDLKFGTWGLNFTPGW